MKENQQGKSTGAIFGAIIILIILVLGGILLSKQESKNAPSPDNTAVESIDQVPTADEVTNSEAEEVSNLSSSTEPTAIEADIDVASDLVELEAELNALEAELGF